MYRLIRLWSVALAVALSFFGSAVASGLPVISTHPRLLLTPAIMTRLLAKKSANDPAWLALKARADVLTTYSIFPYKYATRTQEPDNTIFYDYQGSGWFDAVMPLALAYKMTGNQAYLNKLLAIADEMLRAQSDPSNNPPIGRPPLQPDSYYPTRYLGYVIGIIFDWCYDDLGATRKAKLVALMNAYFDDMRANAYQANSNADGNYFGGHLMCAAAMGYASFGSNSRAQAMIDYARIRFDGTPGAVPASNIPNTHFNQLFDGGFPPQVALDYLGPNITGSPFLGGFDFQGWAYGSGEYERIIDYLLMVNSATGEDLLTKHLSWFSQIFHAEKQALFPNHFMIDPSGDWGGDQGAVIPRGVPARLAYILDGTSDGPAAEHFATSEIADSTFPDVTVYPLTEWEDFFFSDPTRPSTANVEPLYYSAFSPAYPKGGRGNGAVPYFIMRSDSGPDAVWAGVRMASEYYDDHQHHDAGTMTIARGNDYLLVDASNWKGPDGSEGIVGSSTEAAEAASKNTLFFNDFGDYMYPDEQYFGGQAGWGIDQVVAAEQNLSYTYARSDLSTAYNRASDPADAVNRKLDFFYRSFLYFRRANLFVVYDRVKAKPSTNSQGAYAKHLRWHLPNRPTISGQVAMVQRGSSRLYLRTLLPAIATFKVVDESTNPDPCDGAPPGCTRYGADSGTFRLEVRDPNNPLFIPFLTILEPTVLKTPSTVATSLNSNDGLMIGSLVVRTGASYVFLFNGRAGQVPTPVASTSYAFNRTGASYHVLAGMVPKATYKVTLAGGVVQIAQDLQGSMIASPAGVLSFALHLPSTPTPTATRTPTPTRTATRTATATAARTATRTPTPTKTRTATKTATRTATKTATKTATRAATSTRTATPTATP